jgi:predicted acylesterase/phospholipase RssA
VCHDRFWIDSPGFGQLEDGQDQGLSEALWRPIWNLANDWENDMNTALVLGGGAPTLTLMAGALLALDEEKVEFSVVSTSGAGMLVGLLYAAARGRDRQAALRATVDMGVHDTIYKHFPINYKVFYKPGSWADAYTKMIWPFLELFPQATSEERFIKDWVTLMCATFSPSGLSLDSKGLCQAAPWIENFVDFDALKSFGPEFLINAWNLRERQMRIFPKEEITASHFRAALAFPFIYAPWELDGDFYIEGSAMDTLNLKGLLDYEEAQATIYQQELKGLEHLIAGRKPPTAKGKKAEEEGKPDRAATDLKSIHQASGKAKAMARRKQLANKLGSIEKIVVFDVLGSDKLLRPPRDLYDAWVMSMIVPLVEIAKDDLKLFELKVPGAKDKLHRINFDKQIPEDHLPNMLDWSYGNLTMLFQAGYRAGKEFYLQNQDWLPESKAKPAATEAA